MVRPVIVCQNCHKPNIYFVAYATFLYNKGDINHGDESMNQQKSLPFGKGQLFSLAAYGVMLWFGAAMLLRTLGPLGVFDGAAHFILYLLVIPGTWPFLLIAQRIAGLARTQMGLGVAIVTASAALLDGLAFAWFPGLYSADPVMATASAGAILWGVGVGLVLGLVMNKVE
jgi:hypothetical protein